jgi:hypothetical protein
MEYWEFLLQKEGDRSWLPLESPSAEILEGRYRVVARSSRVRTPVEIRVIHDATAEVPPKRRVQKRSGQTNPEGLLVVIPFTRLQPGRWELRCTSDLMADMIGESWEYAVQLQVLYNDPEMVDDWEPDWEGSGAESLTQATQAGVARAPDPQAQPTQAGQNGAIALSIPSSNAESAESEVAASPAFIQTETQADAPVLVKSEQPDEAAEIEITPDQPQQPEQLEQIPLEPEAQISATLSDEAIDEPLSNDSADVAEERANPEGAIAAITAAAADLADSLADSLAESVDVANAAPDVEVTQPVEALPESLDASSLLQAAEQMSQQVVEAIFDEFDPENDQTIDQAVESILKEFEAGSTPAPLPAIKQASEGAKRADSSPPGATSGLLEASAAAVTAPQLQVTLEREAYVVRRGRSFRLVGRVELLDSENQVASTVRVSKLQIRLHDPKTSQVVAEVHQPLADKAVPFSFSCPIATPAQGQTHLFLGEVLFYAVPTVGIPTKVLATQSFTVAADMEELLEAIATEPTPLDLQLPLVFAGDTDILNLEFLDLVNSPGAVVQFQSSNASSLPPQLHPAKPGSSPTKPLELPLADDPNFTLSGNAEAVRQFLLTQAQTGEAASAISSELPEGLAEDQFGSNESSEELAKAIADLEFIDSGEIPGETATGELPADIASATETFPEAMLESEEDAPEKVNEGEEGDRPETSAGDRPFPASENQSEPTAEPSEPEDKDFPTANLKNRFWSRLNSLATDADPSDSLSAPPDQSPFVDGITLGVDADLVAQEIVVDDEPLPSKFRGRWGTQPDTPLALPNEEPVPTPQIELPKGELVAGKSVSIIVKLPDLTPRIYVKLWLHDRQTRSLLDGPHWLMNFLPNGSGELEVRTQLTVPFGCFEIQFEAIAIEMATQRESHKIIVDRMVIPPDLPTLSLDELDV